MEISSTATDKSPAAGWISCNTCIAGIRGCCVTQGLREGSLFGFLRRGTRGPLWRSTGYTGFPQNNVCPRVFPFFLATPRAPPSALALGPMTSHVRSSDHSELPRFYRRAAVNGHTAPFLLHRASLRDKARRAQGVVLATSPAHGRRLASASRSSLAGGTLLNSLHRQTLFSPCLFYIIHCVLFI